MKVYERTDDLNTWCYQLQLLPTRRHKNPLKFTFWIPQIFSGSACSRVWDHVRGKLTSAWADNGVWGDVQHWENIQVFPLMDLRSNDSRSPSVNWLVMSYKTQFKPDEEEETRARQGHDKFAATWLSERIISRIDGKKILTNQSSQIQS